MPDDTNLPHLPSPPMNIETALGEGMPTSLRILFDDHIWTRVRQLAGYMADDTAFTPKHLRGKPHACFTVISMALNWRLDPNFVGRNTYETPGGQIGFMGSLVQGVVEESGRLVGGVKRQYVGDWTKVVGKFEKKKGSTGKEYAAPTWTPQDAAGLGIILSARLKGEAESRYWPAENEPFFLTQCFPLNSPLWATDPKTQIFYLAVRRFAYQAVPGLLGGMPFDEDALLDASERARDITPLTALQPAGDETSESETGEPDDWFISDHTGSNYKFERYGSAVEAVRKILIAVGNSPEQLRTAWENNAGFIDDLKDYGHQAEHDELVRLYRELAPGDIGHVGRLTTPDEAAASGTDQPATFPPSDVSEQDAAGEQQVGVVSVAGNQGAPPPPIEASSEGPAERSGAEVSGAASDRPNLELVPPDPAQPDHFWNRKSLTVDPGYVSGSLKPDWPKWPTMIQPRIHQAQSREVLDALWTDNFKNWERYCQAQGEKAGRELQAEFMSARERLGA